MASQPPNNPTPRLTARQGERVIHAFPLTEATELTLGAAPQADCCLTTEKYLSRRHVRLRLQGDQLDVERLPTAANPVIFKGASADRFRMRAGEYFVIGTTSFFLEGVEVAAPTAAAGPTHPTEQFTLGVEELQVGHDAGDRLRLLDLMRLPEVLRTRSRKDFFVYACGGLRMATGARWVQVLACEPDALRVLCEDAGVDRAGPRPQSRTLVKAAVDEAPQPVAYAWHETPNPAPGVATAHEGVDWAVACAMPIPGETPILFYLAGAEPASGGAEGLVGPRLPLRDIARLVGLVADAIGRAVAVQKLEDWQAKLGHFFSGKLVSKILESEDPAELAPQIRRASVMFFDIRGFSLLTEDNLRRILAHQGDLRHAMTVMTQTLFDHDGVVIRYMGDGILACWNVPYDLDRHEERACLAALSMVDRLAHATEGWSCGIGLGVGDLVAGSLGSEQVYAYDVLGPVVNQAARVESLTKEVGVPILVTAEVARALSPDRVMSRRVARFLPVGMETELDLYTIEATPDDEPARTAIADRHAIHADALAAFEAGDWDKAFDLLHPIVKEDEAARYVYTLALQRKPPRDWRGVIEMTHK